MYRVVLWGAGDGYNLFTQLHGHNQVNVVAVADKNPGCMKFIDGIPVIVPERINEYEYDYLVVSVMDDRIYKEIIKEAEGMGIKRENILSLRIFQIPFFDFEKYIKIKNSNISILSDYCFAGYLYHKFDLKFLSPTINMFTDNENYYRFISNLKKYMYAPMKEVQEKEIMEKPYEGLYFYPRGIIEDVEWQFNHDVVYSTAAERWKRGIERFNWDNYIVIMTIHSEEMAIKFDQLPIEHKIGFYWKDLGLESVICMPEWNDASYRAKFGYLFSGLVNKAATETRGIRAVNWMKALLHEEDYSRVK